MKCFKCGNALPDDSKFCQYCGTDLAQGHYCSNCGAVMQEEMNFCPKCGHQVQGQRITEEPMVCSEEAVIADDEVVPEAAIDQERESVDTAVGTAEPETVIFEENLPKKRKKKWIPLVAVCVAIAGVIGFFALRGGNGLARAAENVLYLEVYDSSDTCIGSGSGFLIKDDVTLVTNYHVIEDAYRMIAMTADGKQSVEVDTVLAYDKDADLAILKCSEKIGVVPLTLADSDQVKQGDAVYAAGYPLGIANTLSDGIVSSRYVDEYGVELLQITAPISGGSSGGALLNKSGQVVGVVCAYYADGQNMNLAIAANMVDYVLEESKHTQSLLGLYLEKHPPVKPDEFTSAFEETRKELIEKYGEPGTSDSDKSNNTETALDEYYACVRTISVPTEELALQIYEEWQSLSGTEDDVVAIMDKYAPEQGGGKLHFVNSGMWEDEVDQWCFDETRKIGDAAIIETYYEYSLCYFSDAINRGMFGESTWGYFAGAALNEQYERGDITRKTYEELMKLLLESDTGAEYNAKEAKYLAALPISNTP